MRVKFQDTKDGSTFKVSPDHYFSCCDCGLVHFFRFTLKKGEIYVTVSRRPKITARLRKTVDYLFRAGR